jgi:hypothetical protein
MSGQSVRHRTTVLHGFVLILAVYNSVSNVPIQRLALNHLAHLSARLQNRTSMSVASTVSLQMHAPLVPRGLDCQQGWDSQRNALRPPGT